MNKLNALFDIGYTVGNTVSPPNYEFLKRITLSKFGYILEMSISYFDFEDGDDEFTELAKFIKLQNIPIYFISEIGISRLKILQTFDLNPINIGNTEFDNSHQLKVPTVRATVCVESNTFEADIKLCSIPNSVNIKIEPGVHIYDCKNLVDLKDLSVSGLDSSGTTLSIYSCESIKSIDTLGPKINQFIVEGSCSNFSFEKSNLTFDILEISTDFDSKVYPKLSPELINPYNLLQSNVTVIEILRIRSRLKVLNAKQLALAKASLEKLADKVCAPGAMISLRDNSGNILLSYVKT